VLMGRARAFGLVVAARNVRIDGVEAIFS
jgi:hypothetical protein